MSEAGAGIGAYDANLSLAQARGEFEAAIARRRAELVDSLDGARRKLQKQEAFLAAAQAEVERLEQALHEAFEEVSDDGVVSE